MTHPIELDCHGQTDVGRERADNQDQFLVADLSKSMLVNQTSLSIDDRTRLRSAVRGRLMVVADGMGGHQGGARASQLAVHAITHYALNFMPWFFRLDEQNEDDLHDELKNVLEKARAVLLSDVTPDRQGMGTTVTMAYVLWPRLYVVHAGDSRCYLMRGGRLRQITDDHTLAQQMVDEGAMDSADAEDSRFSHIVVNALVASKSTELDPDVKRVNLAPGDQLLLCSDGLTGPVADNTIAEVLQHAPTAEFACQQLVAQANAAGGPDNTTVVVARFLPQEQRDALH